MKTAELTLHELYTEDETAWLDAMAELVRLGLRDDLDFPNLLEFLTDMARRDRREVESRLIVLMLHILKWLYQPEQRSRSWQLSIAVQRQELQAETGKGVLRQHAEAMLGELYLKAVERACIETGLPTESFPAECPFTLDDLLTFAPDAV